jgi:uncharacterized LabA/DUF88 family protein
MVRIFDRRRKKTDAAEPAKPKAEPAQASARSAQQESPAKAPPARAPRTTRGRPPRRDWAAEAAAAPIGTPLPLPSSLASTPADRPDISQRRRSTRGARANANGNAAEPAAPAVTVALVDEDGAAPATRRRRGTRGGRGRKKPGSAAVPPPAATALAPLFEAPDDATLESAIARQSRALEAFARDMQASIKGLQSAIGNLQSRGGDGIAAASTAHPRVGIFVDVPNLIYASERRNLSIDFGRVLDYFTRGRQLVRASAYAPISDDPQAKLETQRFVSHFIGHPYRIITKPLKRFADGSMKANFDIELAIDILTMSDRLDVVVLMSGDGDFRRLVELISSRGVRVEIVAFSESVSSELKAVADLYVDIGAHLEDFKTLR